MKKLLLGLLFVIFAQNSYAFQSNWQEASDQNNATKLRIIGSYYNDTNTGQKLIIGLHFKMEKGWKIYGKDTNGMGLPPSFDFKGSVNYANHEILWPKPIIKEEKIGAESFKYSVYEDETVIPLEITKQDAKKSAAINLKVTYGVCKDICIPAAANFNVQVSADEDLQALELIQNYTNKKLIAKNETSTPQEKPRSKSTLLSALIAAALGGLILNIMPCVLPVLGIKMMSIINHDHARPSHIRLAFAATIIGILSCFIIFSFFAAFIGYSGNIFNWGLQFQNPYFLIFLIIILIAFIANMLGLFNISYDSLIANVINQEIAKRGHQIFIPNFLSGVLAVLLATPCSAPFLGSAISFSILQNTSTIFLIFLVMGLGFAAPYIVLLVSPKLIYLLPKPGSWMKRAKDLMAGLLAATVMWLIYVLAHNLGALPAFIAAVISILILGSFKIRYKFLKILAFTALIAAIFALPTTFQKLSPKNQNPMDRVWKKFDENEIYNLITQGNVVVIDVTADWCLTCKFNKFNVLHDKDIMAKLTSDNIVAMRADITTPDAEVLSFINRKGRYAIPFNAVYGPNAKDGLLTNELLSKKELLQKIGQAAQK